MKLSAKWVAALVLAAAGCGGDPTETRVPTAMGDIPSVVVKAAQKELPEVSFDAAFLNTAGKVKVYEVRGKDKAGKTREVEISREGKVLSVN